METLRSLQDDADGSAEQFSTWTSDYYWLSGRLLRDARSEDLELAFSITERMRARSLLDTLERSRRTSAGDGAAMAARRELLESIAAVQRRLMDPGLAADARRLGLAELQDLELREREARRQIGLAVPATGSGSADAPGCRRCSRRLRDNEALLSFQVGLWETFDGEFGGGSWLIALTPHAALGPPAARSERADADRADVDRPHRSR